MPKFDTILADKTATFDFAKYVSIKALLRAKNWPLELVPLDVIAEALAQEAEIEVGWRPGKSDLKNAPTLYDWSFVDHTDSGRGLRLEGDCMDHPKLRGVRHISTSHVVAMDLANFKWARTLSRLYRLSKSKIVE